MVVGWSGGALHYNTCTLTRYLYTLYNIYRSTMSINVVSDAEWVAARLALLTEEKALSKATAIVAQKRAQLPWRLINDYMTSSRQ